jgi:hypothetical protein
MVFTEYSVKIEKNYLEGGLLNKILFSILNNDVDKKNSQTDFRLENLTKFV